MALNAKTAAGTPRKRPPLMEPGNYPARLVQVIDLGLQPQRPYQGQEKEPAREIGLTWEFLDEFMKDDDGEDIPEKPRWLSENMPLHNIRAEKAKSTLRYKAVDPLNEADGDWTKLLGRPVMINIVNNPSKKDPSIVYENVGGVSPMRPKDAAKAPKLVNVPVFFDLDDPDMAVFTSFPQWLQDKIKSNLEFAGSEFSDRLTETVKDNKPAKAAVNTAQPEEPEDDEDEAPF